MHFMLTTLDSFRFHHRSREPWVKNWQVWSILASASVIYNSGATTSSNKHLVTETTRFQWAYQKDRKRPLRCSHHFYAQLCLPRRSYVGKAGTVCFDDGQNYLPLSVFFGVFRCTFSLEIAVFHMVDLQHFAGFSMRQQLQLLNLFSLRAASAKSCAAWALRI